MPRRTLAILFIATAACRSPTPPAGGVDLLARFAEADRRNDTHDFAALLDDPRLTRRGFSEPEGRGSSRRVWALGPSSRVHLSFHSTQDKELVLRAQAHPDLVGLQARVTLNGSDVGVLAIPAQEAETRLVLPRASQRTGENVLAFAWSRHVEPAASAADKRRLAALVADLAIRPAGQRSGGGAAALDEHRLLLPAGSSAAFHLRVPAGASLAVTGGGRSAEARLTSTLEEDGGTRPLSSVSGNEVDAVEDLAAYAGHIVRLVLANEGAGIVEVRSLRLLTSATESASAAAAPSEAPDIVVFLVDTLRADQLGPYGQRLPTSPHLDAFAREGIVFEDMWAQASWTRSAVASIFTGLHVAQHGADREDSMLGPENLTLAERLRSRGYRTGAYVANHLIGGRFGFDQGFDTWNDGDLTLYQAPAERLVERGLSWLDAQKSPALLYVHTLEPHAPYEPAAAQAAPFGAAAWKGSRDSRALLRLGQLGQLPPDGLAWLWAQYRGEIRQNDAAFGALIEGLRKRGRLDRTIVVFTADHGEELLEHGGTEHAKTLYRELLHIPLVVRLPRAQRAGTRERATVAQIDLLPTLTSFAGGSTESVAGRDLRAEWTGQRAFPAVPPLFFAEERFEVIDKLAVRSGNWKLVSNRDGKNLWRAGTALELYDLAADPAEKVNLVDSRPVAREFLYQELERYRRGVVQKKRLELSAEEKEALRALGYIQ